VQEQLRAQGVAATVFPSPAYPPWLGLAKARLKPCGSRRSWLCACGGGSPLDAAKAIAALATNGGQPLDYMEVVGRGQPLAKPSLPLIAIPTTAGTGSEVTRNAVLTSPEHGVKASMRSFSMVPRIAVVDPELTYGLPPAVTASTGLDALTQLVEPFTCNRTNPLVDALCREGLGRVARSLRRAWSHGHDAAAREDMALASLFGGFCAGQRGAGGGAMDFPA
jgi:alcohol dehydrogenase class IV